MKLLLLLFIFISNITFAQPIRVQGIGDSLQNAKENAFRVAVELRVGSVIVTENETRNSNLVKNEIVNYSAGYVDSYQIIQVQNTNNKTLVIMDVQVSSSKIADRILGVSTKPKIFENEKQTARYDTYIQSKNNGDRLLNSVLNDYPKRAYIIQQYGHRFGVDTNRNPFIEIGFQLNWNYNYLSSLNETLSLIEDGSNGLFKTSPGNVIIMAKDPNDYILGSKRHYKFNDLVAYENIKNTFNQNNPHILLTIYNQESKILHKQCYLPESFLGRKPAFYALGESLVIYGNNKEVNVLKLSLSNFQISLRNIERFELSIVTNESCRV